MEPRVAIGSYNRATEEYTLYVANQNPHVERLLMTAFVLGLPEHKVRVIAPDVGGGFGSKIFLYAEDVALTWAAKQLNRSIKWTGDRSECFLSDAHGRDHVSHAEMAMDKDGKFLALRVHTDANLGAYLSTFSTAVPTILYATLLAGQYTTPQIYVEVDAWFTNTAPVDAYRGAGRPEATYLLERLVSRCAWEMNLGQDEIRKRNFITTFPYQTPVALQYDTGDYHASMNKAQELADVAGFAPAQGGDRGQGQAARHRLLELHRGLRHRAVEHRGRARRARRPVRVRRDPRASDRQRHGVHRLAQPWAGPRDHLRAGGGRAPGHSGGERRRGARRHRPRALRHGHLRLALDLGRRRGDHEGARQDRDQGQEDRGPPDGGERRRRRVRQRRVHRQGHRQEDPLRPGRAHRLRAAQLPARQAGARA